MHLNRFVGVLLFACSLAALAQSAPAPALPGRGTFRPSPRAPPVAPTPIVVAPVAPSPRPADAVLAERRFVLQQQELQALRLAVAREKAERAAAEEAARRRDLQLAERPRVEPPASEPAAAPRTEWPSYGPSPRDAGPPAPDSPIYHWVDAEGVEHFSDEPRPR